VRAAGLRAIVPGVRPAGASVDDQSRIVTPGEAIGRGADWIVLGRVVTRAGDPEAAAAAVADEVAAVMGSSH
jgi:orotidine-5'-phosphate decarboxylase